MLKVRSPVFDFAGVFPHWSPYLEFAQKWNAVSITPVHVEPYLIKVLQKARPLIEKVDPALAKEVDLFIAQEAQHYRQHINFNRCFQTPDYPKLPGDEQKLKDELQDFLDNRSLKFNLAYAEGFESSMGVINAAIWFEEFDDFRQGAKPEALALWDWHMGEEFEHREVCFKVFMALYAHGFWNRIVNGYFYRLWGVWFALNHLGRHVGRIMYHLLKPDWAKMTPAEVEASKARLAEINGRHTRVLNRRILAVLSPFYNPNAKRPPRGLERALAMAEPGGIYGRGAKI